mmetsp:Transcript_15382/g.21037  ORF Transcript_15382/g.21037 Transcript_15382/m.21037 type:complete len:218 (-) Transcript_15382:446-1099(-)
MNILSTILSIFITGKVRHSKLSKSCPSNGTFNTKNIITHRNPNVTHFTPVLSPRVTNDPVLTNFFVHSPSYNRNNVIYTPSSLLVSKDTTLVIINRGCVNSSSNWTTVENLRLDSMNILMNNPIFRNSRIREHINLRTSPTITRKSITSPASISSRTSSIHMLTKSFRRFRRTSRVNLTSFIRHVPRILDKLIHTRVISAVTRSSHIATAIQYELDG